MCSFEQQKGSAPQVKKSDCVKLEVGDCGWMTGKQEVIGIGEFLTPLDPKLRISSG